MSGGEILILAVLILGAVIATLGDRIGTRVGKARLSLFNLRPRKTATLVTIFTGILISASTLGILFAASNQLRTGVFELGTIQRRLRNTRTELEAARNQKGQVESELTKARADRASAKKQLTETNQSLRGAIAERSRAQAETARTQTALNLTQGRLAKVSQQALRLRSEIGQLQVARDRVIAQREQEIRARDQIIQQREARLKDLEKQQEALARDVQALQLTAQGLRTGNVVIQRGQVLASLPLRTTNTATAKQAIDQLLREANQSALRLVRPGASEQIVQITNADVKQLIEQIDDGQDYIVRIYSGANYLVGEKFIQVFADAVKNRVIFLAGDVVAGTSLNPSTMSDDQIQQRINLLLAAANFRARNLGVLTDSVQIGRIQDVITFIEQLKQYKQTVELKAVAADVTYTAGPLNIDLIASQNGQVLLRTKNLAPTGGQTP
ncbi:DUF3084 domain-containing protein [Stenomitos frigidus]|uniref:DUF3084 domain-containing protein n=1 Tax=Stenomitos frigidus ULC18 TaxID=2107698 RepID=A0A2T1ELL3_9CYAN|nr:DUF3084 domain-containing protein [Stenomitos frigidus]PSB33640.1 DUF3084 domain-containing protein [Stenomitos frigidus ULC18]